MLGIAAVSAAAEDDNKPLLLSSIRPLYLIVLALGGDAVDARVLQAAQASPHEFVLLPSDMRMLHGARQLFWIGPELERPLAELLRKMPDSPPSLALSQQLPELGAGGTTPADPHIWLDPGYASLLAAAIAESLREQGIVDESELERRLRRFQASMRQTERDIRKLFAGLENVPFLSMHDAWSYFVQRFGLNLVGTLAADSDHQPGARSIAAMRRIATRSDAVCLIRDPQENDRLASSVAEGTKMRVLELDAVASTATEDADGYADYLLGVAESLAGCLRGDRREPTESGV